MYDEKTPYSLMTTTIELLKDDERSLINIHKETNIPFYWLRKFAAGEFENPSVNRVQCLYEFLTKKKLDV